MKRFEYRVERLIGTRQGVGNNPAAQRADIAEQLNEYGVDGWEVSNFEWEKLGKQAYVVFKRLKE